MCTKSNILFVQNVWFTIISLNADGSCCSRDLRKAEGVQKLWIVINWKVTVQPCEDLGLKVR